MSEYKTAMERKAFWNKRSSSFPGHTDGEDTYQAKMLAIAQEHGVDFKGHTVLDLGCGTGSYTIRMARAASKVTALDISEGMLNAVKESAGANSLTNIELVCADWAEYVPQGKFDIILCSLTPAVSDRQAVEKIRMHAAKWVIHISFAGPMKAHLLDGLFNLHNYEYKRGEWEVVMRPWLEENNISFVSNRVQGEWVKEYSREAILSNCLDVLAAHRLTPNMRALTDYIEQFWNAETGTYLTKTAYDVEIIIADFSVIKAIPE